ncbi:unnamed protein product [Lepeophtheirus salmonis]|uniref:(salmon louse) hypothetical protein n=1 Tax=Lepeophtheirus salmonis TaxID=72036 RepID=A0A7R8H4E1_LEPSM|nr:unnamed protein product [Lepeophtheirus salmonis]CAF2858213.1 unnamed protein product [Lepeophtheirus salmonis]
MALFGNLVGFNIVPNYTNNILMTIYVGTQLNYCLPDQISNEENAVKVNSDKIVLHWRGFERALQKKKHSHLDILMKDLYESEEQHNAAFRCQIQQNLLRDYQKLRDDVRNRNMEEKQSLQLQKEEGIENLMRKIRQQVNSHQKATEDKRRLYDYLLAKDKKDIEEVAENHMKIQKLTNEVNRLKQKFQGLGEFENKKLLNLRQEKEELMSSLFKSRKEIGIINRNVEENKLKKFVVMLNTLKESVENLMDRYESIVKIAEQCQRYEDKERSELKLILSTYVKRAVSRVGGDTFGVTDLKGNVSNMWTIDSFLIKSIWDATYEHNLNNNFCTSIRICT